MKIQINGETRDVAEGLSLSDLIQTLSLAAQRVAVEVNKQIVRRDQWQHTTIQENDRIEIVHFVGGGEEQ